MVTSVTKNAYANVGAVCMESSDARRLSAFTKGRQTSVDRTIDADKCIAALDRKVIDRLQRTGALA